MSSPTELYFPPDFPYPIKIVSLDVRPSAPIQRGTRLLSYCFTYVTPERGARPETRYGTWDSTVEGTVDKWGVKLGEVISRNRAKDKHAVLVTEPCKHGVQIGGLCGLCGKDMTDYDYTGFSDSTRASIQMTHLAHGPTVSLEEAQRIERETAEHLLKSCKLSLIVDLDQTIVHATVDPTVGEWIAEGEAWQAKQASKTSSAPKDDDDDSSSDSDWEEPVNPNWEALKDVKKFRLAPEAFGTPPGRHKGKGKVIENEGCLYYIKPRPGLQEFLKSISTKYEMHVYTMGTRAYAEEVCNAIDPDGKLFGGRLLSRDESGSLTQKSLQRLFPCDTSMVVIIDDRADVWEWSPNLIKVIPYDFFVGIGDINSTFLPKVNPLAPVLPPAPPTVPDHSNDIADAAVTPTSPTPTSLAPSPDSSDSSTTPSTPSEESEQLAKNAILAQNSLALEAQLEERPLAKKQEELESASPGDTSDVVNGEGSENGPPRIVREDVDDAKHKASPKALLKNDDNELQRLEYLLGEVHNSFYEAYNARGREIKRPKRSAKSPVPPEVPYDVKVIIPRIRMQTLEGVHILFSSVIPLDTNPQSTEIWRMANAFGAKCYTELSSHVTHVVAAKRGTVKVDTARKRGGIKIVWVSWFTDSIALWRRQDETPYLLDELSVTTEAADSSPKADSNQVSSDPEPDADDWDEPVEAPKELEINREVDWFAAGKEVEDFMAESDDDDVDDEDNQSVKSGLTSGNMSDDEVSVTEENDNVLSSVDSTPVLKRKRSRTPSETGLNNYGGPDNLRSPLAKRKRIAAARSGSSRLKLAISAEELEGKGTKESGESDTNTNTEVNAATDLEERGSLEEEDNDDGEEDGDGDDEDDFLARELEEEWG